MSIKWNTLDSEKYGAERWKLFVSVEESGNPKSTAYIDPEGIPTIGVGFNLREAAVRDEVLRSLGFSYINNPENPGGPQIPAPEEQRYVDEIVAIINRQWSDTVADEAALQNELDAVMQRRFGDEAVSMSGLRPDFMYVDDAEIRGTFDVLIEGYEARVLDQWYPDLPEFSKERITLVSLAYNAKSAEKDSPLTPHNDKHFPSLLGPRLWNAINDGNRAEAWYQIRYKSNGGDSASDGIAKRRYAESALFGLYNDPSNVSDEEAAQVLQMVLDHRERISTYETEYGHMVDDADALSSEFDVKDLGAALLPIKDYVAEKYIPADILADLELSAIEGVLVGVTHTDDGKIRGFYQDTEANAKNELLVGIDGRVNLISGSWGNDVLVGGDQGDRLWGGSGNDTLIGKGGSDRLNGYNGEDTLHGGTGNDDLYGGADNDTLIGGEGMDHLEGGAGSDTLYGGDAEGNDDGIPDLLAGGAGEDTYYVNLGDVIDDTEGQSTVYYDGEQISGTYQQVAGTNIYQQQGGERRLWVDADGVAHVMGSYLTLKNFDPAHYGITLVDGQGEPLTDHTLVGDLKWKDHNDSEPGIQTRTDELGNIIYDSPAEEEPDQDDTLYDSTSNDHIQSGGGEDVIYAFRGGDDHIEAGEGQDIADGGAGTDLIEGGAGSDTLLGESGEDVLYGDAGYINASLHGNTLSGADNLHSDNTLHRLIA